MKIDFLYVVMYSVANQSCRAHARCVVLKLEGPVTDCYTTTETQGGELQSVYNNRCGTRWIECGPQSMKFAFFLPGILSTWLGLSSSLFSNDTTQAGYSLGMPKGRSTLPSPERSLSPAACCLTRALMHSALLWASCNNEVHTQWRRNCSGFERYTF